MTDNEIIEALERCGYHKECCYCNSVEECGSKRVLVANALELINRQKAEIERLQSTVDSFTDIGKMYSEIKAEAYKEFAERLCAITKAIPEMKAYFIRENDLDNLLKEMVGDSDA